MKYILSVILGIFLSVSVQAKETITVYYAFSLGDSVANYHRTLITEANKIQDKYLFVFDSRPGAGGSIAANYILNNPNSIAAHSTAFFVRPNIYPNESYNINNYKMQFIHCDPPFAVSSGKFKSWKDIPNDAKATIGVSGLGATTHLVSLQLKKYYPNLIVVPFKSTNDSMLSMVSGQTDLHIGFLSEAEQWMGENKTSDKKVYILGLTGKKAVKSYPLLTNQGFGSLFANLTSIQHFVIPANWEAGKVKELNEIFNKAAKSDSVRLAYAVDYCEPHNLRYEELNNFFDFNATFWKRMSSEVKLN